MKNRIIIYTTEAQSGVTNGDWEEGDTLEQAQEKATAVLEELGHNQIQIKALLKLYKQTSTQTMTTLPSNEWNNFYAHCVDCRSKNWVSDSVWHLILKQAIIVDKAFTMPAISEVTNDEYETPIPQIAYHKTITDEEIEAILNEPSPVLVSERG